MANKSLFQSITSVIPRATDRQRSGRPGLQVRAEARAGPDGGDRYVR